MYIPNKLPLKNVRVKFISDCYMVPRYTDRDTYFFVMKKYDIFGRIYNRLGKWYYYSENKGFRVSCPSFQGAILKAEREVRECAAS